MIRKAAEDRTAVSRFFDVRETGGAHEGRKAAFNVVVGVFSTMHEPSELEPNSAARPSKVEEMEGAAVG